MFDWLANWFDQFALAAQGFLLATRRREFWPPFCLTFLIFGTLLNLLSNGFASFALIFASSLAGAGKILLNAFLGIFGVGKSFGDFFLNLVLILLQSVLVALVCFVAQHNRQQRQSERTSAALVAGLAVLGSGCPTCGTTLLAPVLGALLSGSASAVALAGTLSLVLNILAILLAILVFKKLGFIAYATIKSETYTEKHHAKSN